MSKRKSKTKILIYLDKMKSKLKAYCLYLLNKIDVQNRSVNKHCKQNNRPKRNKIWRF